MRRLIDGRVADARAANRSFPLAAESICADVSWRHLLVQSDELRAFRLRATLAGRPHVAFSSVLALALFVSPARCYPATPVDGDGIVYVDAHNDNARPRTSSLMSR